MQLTTICIDKSHFLPCISSLSQNPVQSVLNPLFIIMDAFTPAQTTELVSRIGTKKARMRIDKMFVNSFMGGPLLGFGCALLLSTNSAPWFQTNAPGLIRTIGASFFPVGLIMVILTGADLFTSYVLVSANPLFLSRHILTDFSFRPSLSYTAESASLIYSKPGWSHSLET